jgi:AraC-like DNA-binding protein
MLPPARLHRLRTADAARFTVTSAPAWGEALELVRFRPIELVVVDPLLQGRPRMTEIERLRLLFPSLPVVVYTALVPEVAGVLLSLGQLGIRRAVFDRIDDAPAALRAVLQQELEGGVAQQVMQALAERLAPLPAALRWALESMVHASAESATVTALAERALLTRRTVERCFGRAGLPSPRTVVQLVRALYAHRLLLDPGYTVEDVALRLGFGRARMLNACLRDVFGCTAGDLRASYTLEETLAMITARHFTPAAQAAS